jgi:DNA-binding transcriptional LysR family regulator
MPFDMRHIRYVIAAADHGSFYRAARAIGVEQSTLSRSVLRLERALGSQIFDLSRAGVTMTAAGARFIYAARPLVASAEQMVSAMRAAGQGRAGLLKLGLNSSVSAGNLRATILAWRADHSGVDFESVEADRGALLAALDSGKIDIAVLMGEASHSGYQHKSFWSERILAALPEAHPLAARDIVLWTDLRLERFILPAGDPGPDIRDMLLGRLSKSGSQPDISMSETSREAVLSFLGAGRRISIVCEGSIGVRYPDVVYRPVHGEQGPALIVYSGYWRHDNANPALKRFLVFIRQRYALIADFS